MLKAIIALLISCFITVCYADVPGLPLPAEQAFALTVSRDANKQWVLDWKIAPGYYLYRHKIHIILDPKSPGKLGAFVMPAGETKKDEVNGVFQAFSGSLRVLVPLQSAASLDDRLIVSYQGCSSSGFCYPPIKKTIALGLTSSPVAPLNASVVDQGYATELFANPHLFFIILGFLGLGLLLAFTPCVLPMVPILSSIIVGQGKVITTKKSFLLSLAYVLGMALAYACAGVAVALVGSNIQIILQKPAVIMVFSGLFALLALSLFGLFEIHLPNKLHQRVLSWSHRHQGGTYVGVFLMGVLSTLIVSPCVSAPLVGALAYIAKSGNVILGFTALLALGIGMGIPLLLIGASAGKLLPRTGEWMHSVKQFFGILMLAVAVWMLGRIWSGAMILFLWSLIAIGTAIFFWYVCHSKKIRYRLHHGVGLLLLSYGFILLGGSLQGQTDPFYLWTHSAEKNLSFVTVSSPAHLDEQLALAKQNKQPVLLDFYADWCAACVVMDKHVFNQPAIKNALTHFVLLRVDVTKDNEFDRALLKRYQVVAPPTILFFRADGNELGPQQIVGEVNATQFLTKLDNIDLETKRYCQSTRSC